MVLYTSLKIPVADLDDFDNSEIVVTFQPDETGQQMNDVDTPVPIVNDRVNEAEEQNFMVTLDLVNATDESRVDIERIDALCRIIDDDGEYPDLVIRY